MITHKGENLVFILSLPRSGSTLLSAILGAHPRVYSPPEPWFLLPLSGVRHPAGPVLYSESLAKQRTEAFLPDEMFVEAARQFALDVYNGKLAHAGAEIFVDKTPRYYHILEFIDAMFPMAKKIWLQRNPLDVALSYKESWGVSINSLVGDTVDENSFDLTVGFTALANYFEKKSGQKTTVSYESLALDPVTEAKKLCAFLGINFEPGQMSFLESKWATESRGSEIGDTKIFKTTSVHTNSIGGWREKFGQDDIRRLASAIDSEAMVRAGYKDALLEVGAFAPFASNAKVLELHNRLRDEFAKKFLATMREKEDLIQTQESSLKEKDGLILRQESSLKEKGGLILRQESSLKEKDGLILRQESSLKEKDDLIQSQELSLKEKDGLIQTQESSLKEKDASIQSQELSLKEKDGLIQTQESSLKEKDASIQSQQSSLKEKDDLTLRQESSLKEKDDLTLRQELSLKEKEDFIQGQERRCQAFQELLRPQTWHIISQEVLGGYPVADGLAKKAPNSRVTSALMWGDSVYVRLFRPRLLWLDTCYARFFKPRLTWLSSVYSFFSRPSRLLETPQNVIAREPLAVLSPSTGSGQALSKEAISNRLIVGCQDCFASLAMTVKRVFQPMLTWLANVRRSLSSLKQKLSASVASFFSPGLGALFQYSPRDMKIPGWYFSATPPQQPLTLSIVTPAYNHADFLERTMKSVLDQGYPWLEYIVQDGGSKDGTVDLLKRYADKLTRWDSARDKGQGNAINLGFAHTTGEIMAYLNSDDIYLPGTINYVTSFFASHPDVDVVYGHRVIINENDMETGRWVMPPHDNAILEWADYVPQETMFWRRKIWDKAGGWMDESFQFALDWDLIMRFRSAGAKFVRLPRFLAGFRVHMRQKTLTDIGSTGSEEMGRIRERCRGRSVSYVEINEHVAPYLKKHVLFQKLYEMGLLRY